MDAESEKPNPIYKILIMVLPVGVVIGTAIFMYMYFYMERKDNEVQSVIVSRDMKVDELSGLVEKFTERIGLRDIDSEKGRKGLQRAASMIEGSLGPQNLGLTVTKAAGEPAHGLLWKGLSVDIRGVSKPDEVVIAAVSYSGAGHVSDANTVSSMMMLINSMAREKPVKTIRFVFLPLLKTVPEQNKLLLTQCIREGEESAGIVGIGVMEAAPDLAAQGWLSIQDNKEVDLQNVSAVSHLWLTHTVYSPETWASNPSGRFVRSLELAREIRAFLLKSAS